ncbi:zinc finger protein 34-like isoform X2 [Centruroides sculpturatus]|uniref:zinc finger protein 34-like isoform X2 n=1 Tax=Centruroides sculpturatus TaxID=218467 RepID=UPI000C6E5E17|nr:zinc finger protein 34-like isoform X2 [Centruroides sculpturatus]
MVYRCLMCDVIFHDKYIYRSHQLNHSMDKHRCKVCRQGFVTEKALLEHMNGIHLEAKPYVCGECSKACFADFTTEEKLLQHNNDHEIFTTPTQPLQELSIQTGSSGQNVQQPWVEAGSSTRIVQETLMRESFFYSKRARTMDARRFFNSKRSGAVDASEFFYSKRARTIDARGTFNSKRAVSVDASRMFFNRTHFCCLSCIVPPICKSLRKKYRQMLG